MFICPICTKNSLRNIKPFEFKDYRDRKKLTNEEISTKHNYLAIKTTFFCKPCQFITTTLIDLKVKKDELMSEKKKKFQDKIKLHNEEVMKRIQRQVEGLNGELIDIMPTLEEYEILMEDYKNIFFLEEYIDNYKINEYFENKYARTSYS